MFLIFKEKKFKFFKLNLDCISFYLTFDSITEINEFLKLIEISFFLFVNIWRMDIIIYNK